MSCPKFDAVGQKILAFCPNFFLLHEAAEIPTLWRRNPCTKSESLKS